MDLLRWSTVSITALYTPKWMHIICIGRESNHKGRTHPKRGCLSYILYSSTLLISIRNNKRNDPFRADVNWNFTLYSWPPLPPSPSVLFFFFYFFSSGSSMCVFGRLLLLYRVRFLFFFCHCLFIAFDDHTTNNKRGEGEKNSWKTLCGILYTRWNRFRT